MENEALTRENEPSEGLASVEEGLGDAEREAPYSGEDARSGEVGGEPASPSEEPLPRDIGDDGYYARLAEEDLAAIRAAAPELALPRSLSELRDPARYGELREAGLTPLEAYLAVEGRRLQRPPHGGRDHLAPSVSRTAARGGGRIATGELLAARDLFPSLSDGEIESLWRRTRSAR